MSDAIYSITLEDNITPGLKRISDDLEKMQKKADKGVKLPQNQVKTPKIPKIAETKSVDSVEKLDKVLTVLGPTVGRVAGQFGFLGDVVESSTGAMIGMGGKAGAIGASLLAVGVTGGIVAASLYGMYKWFEKIIDTQTKFNQENTTVRGNLGKFSDKTKEVIDAAKAMNAGIGKNVEDVEAKIAKMVKSTGNINAGKAYATMSAAMEKYGEAGAEVNKVLDAISNKNLKSIKLQEIAGSLVSLGAAKNDTEAFTMAQKMLSKTSEEQLKTLLSNKEAISKLRKEASDSVSPFEKLKLQFENTIAIAFGAQGPTPLGLLLDKITAWLATEDAQKKFTALFSSITESMKKITPDNIDTLAKSFGNLIGYLTKTVKFLETISELAKIGSVIPMMLTGVVVKESEKNDQVAKGMAFEEAKLAKESQTSQTSQTSQASQVKVSAAVISVFEKFNTDQTAQNLNINTTLKKIADHTVSKNSETSVTNNNAFTFNVSGQTDPAEFSAKVMEVLERAR